jgi:hypothetical protein
MARFSGSTRSVALDNVPVSPFTDAVQDVFSASTEVER